MRFSAVKFVEAVLLAALITTGIGCAKQARDSQITQQIQAKLEQDSGLQGKSLTVQVSEGVVTLSGTVENDTQRSAAAQYASTVTGVKTVVNNLQVGTVAQKMPAANKPRQAAAPPLKSLQEKPKPTGSARAKKSPTSGRDPSEWDSADSSTGAHPDAPTNQIAAATPVPAPAAPVTPPPAPAPKNLTIQSGTSIAVRLVEAIDSETAQAGETFRATLDAPLSAGGDVAVPAGYNVEGHVVDVKSAGKFAGQSLLVLQLDRISVGGKSYNVDTDPYRRQGSSRSKNTAEKVGAGAVIGAIIGGIAGGGKGAGIGAAAGGGVGGGVQAATKGQQIKLPSETVLTFTLQSPLTVTQVDKGPEAGRPKLDTPH